MTSVKGILLILFLYLGLVWTGSWYVHREQPNARAGIIGDGLWYTMAGLATLLIVLLASWLFGYWKVFRARGPRGPKPPGGRVDHPVPAGHEDDLALRTLLDEASARLLASSAFVKDPGREQFVFAGVPLYLLVGAEGSGKTSAMVNSGLNPELLAGQPRLEKSSPSPTGQANVWLARDGLFVELGGRHFGGDSRRWTELLRVLAARPKVSLWHRLLKGSVEGFDLRGVVHCCDLRFFLSKPGQEQIERQSQLAQERLRAIIKVFGKRVPVFTLFTKGDQIQYFRDFFGRFSEREAEQILGCTLALPRADVDEAHGSVESKRLSKAFNNLYSSITERRLAVLFYEPTAAKKSRIYEFPREFNKLKASVVDFLVQTFRSSPLEPTPLNRGFYFSGTREVEPLPTTLDSTRGSDTVNISFQQALDATIVFRGDPAELRGGIDSDLNVTSVRRGGLLTRWAFLGALFQDVVCRDRAAEGFSPATSGDGLRQPRAIALAVALSVSIFLALVWSISWFQNARIVGSLKESTAMLWTPRTDSGLPSFDDLQFLETLRKSVEELGGLESGSRFWNLWHGSMRFGLYSVDDLAQPVRAAYFRRLKNSLLDLTNAKLNGSLQGLGQSGSSPSNTLKVATDQLKALVMTTSQDTCMVESDLVAAQLTGMLGLAGIQSSDPRFSPAVSQIKFYATELESGLPVDLAATPAARDRALQYIRNSGSEEQHYRGMVDGVAKKLGGYVTLVSARKKILTAPTDRVSKAFTPEGLEEFRSSLNSPGGAALTDRCISRLLGEMPDGKELEPGKTAPALTDDAKRRLENRYSREYLAEWRDFLKSHSLAPFSAKNAAERLDELSGPDSPLLGLFRFVSDNTTYVREEKQEGVFGAIREVLEPPKEVSFTMDGVNTAFQPVHLIVPTGEDKWINQTNGVYVDALARMAQAMGEFDQNPNSLDGQANKKLSDAANEAEAAVKKLRQGFNSGGYGLVGDEVERLLMAPIGSVRGIDIPAPSDQRISAINSKFGAFCADFTRDVLKKYPFDDASARDLPLVDFQKWFVPETGAFWARIDDFSPLVVRDDRKVWKPASQEIRPTQELLGFLKKAQEITNAFFFEGSKMPRLEYSVIPKLQAPTQVLNFHLDGKTGRWTSLPGESVQTDFYWPGGGATARSSARSGDVEFAVGEGPMFRVFHQGQRTSPRTIKWTKTSSGGLVDPPVLIEFVEFPAGNSIDVFEPEFFRTLRCPGSAAQK